MTRSLDETRREFLLRLARGAAFVPPTLLTLSVSRALGAQKGTGGGKPNAAAPTSAATTGVSTAAPVRAFQVQPQEPGAPWDPGRPAGAPPWSKPPPTQAGR